jgi:hypothetical protein
MHNDWLMTRLETATFVAGVSLMAGGANVGSGHYVVLLPSTRTAIPQRHEVAKKGPSRRQYFRANAGPTQSNN